MIFSSLFFLLVIYFVKYPFMWRRRSGIANSAYIWVSHNAKDVKLSMIRDNIPYFLFSLRKPVNVIITNPYMPKSMFKNKAAVNGIIISKGLCRIITPTANVKKMFNRYCIKSNGAYPKAREKGICEMRAKRNSLMK